MDSEGNDEPIIINLKELPPIINSYISSKVEKEKIGKGKILLQLVAWAFMQLYEHDQVYSNQYPGPHQPPKHLREPVYPRELK